MPATSYTQTARHFGGLDSVWNHVGTPGPASIEGLDWKDFDFAIDLNVRSVLVTTEAALPELRARGGGSILFTASTSGLQGSPYSPVYNIAKFGVVGLVKGLAKRYGHENIRVNAVLPGTTDTPVLRVFVARPEQPDARRGNARNAGRQTRCRIRCDASPNPRKSPTPRCSCCRTRRRSLTALRCRSTGVRPPKPASKRVGATHDPTRWTPWHANCLRHRNQQPVFSVNTRKFRGRPWIAAAPAAAVQATATADHRFSFHDFLSAINPLQYLPVVGTIYRAVTGDTIPEALRDLGSMLVSGLLGGPIGLGINIATLAAEKVTGVDPEKIVAAQFRGEASAGAPAKALPATAPALTASSPPASGPPTDAEGASAQLAWSSTQLAAYGVRSNSSGTLTLGDIEGADVLNTLQLVRLGHAAAAYAANETTPSKPQPWAADRPPPRRSVVPTAVGNRLLGA